MKQHRTAQRAFHGEGRRAPYFEGWYFKLRRGGDALAFIVGVSLTGEDRAGPRGRAFIQAVSRAASYQASYPLEAFAVSPRTFAVRVGGSLFTDRGLTLDIPEFACRGRVEFGPLAPPAYDAMGPFCLLPGMECRHSVFSLYHPISAGSIVLAGRRYDFEGGAGYIEGDRGVSFPRRYAWVQGGEETAPGDGVMVSAADIPYMGREFPGCIAMVRLGGREYRLATYTGARVTDCDRRRIRLQQGNTMLDVLPLPGTGSGNALRAPRMGGMDRTIHEELCRPVRFVFTRGGRTLLDRVYDSSVEFAGDT